MGLALSMARFLHRHFYVRICVYQNEDVNNARGNSPTTYRNALNTGLRGNPIGSSTICRQNLLLAENQRFRVYPGHISCRLTSLFPNPLSLVLGSFSHTDARNQRCYIHKIPGKSRQVTPWTSQVLMNFADKKWYRQNQRVIECWQESFMLNDDLNSAPCLFTFGEPYRCGSVMSVVTNY